MKCQRRPKPAEGSSKSQFKQESIDRCRKGNEGNPQAIFVLTPPFCSNSSSKSEVRGGRDDDGDKVDPITALKDKPERSTITPERRATSARSKQFPSFRCVDLFIERGRYWIYRLHFNSIMVRPFALIAVVSVWCCSGPLFSSGNDLFVLPDPIVVATTDNQTVSEQQHSCEWTSGSESSISKSR